MFGTGDKSVFSKAILLMAMAGLAGKISIESRLSPALTPVSARSASVETGEFGGDLHWLSQHWTAPQFPDESNHYIDLWSGGSLAIMARVNGLTNNRTLFVDSHGEAKIPGRASTEYAFYPHPSLLERDQPTPYFSPKDLADLLGPEQASRIHNIVLAGCNEEGRFRSQELRRYFVNATNVTYMTPGQLAYKPMFYQAIVLPSSDIKTLYGKPKRAAGGRVECRIADTPGRGMKALGTYIADLYLPGAAEPFRTRKAGRELLDSTPCASAMLRADASAFSVGP